MEALCDSDEYFQILERWIDQNGTTIDRPKGSAHPRFPTLIYPIDYGFINKTSSQDKDGIDVFFGDLPGQRVVGIICAVDQIKRDSEIKVLLNCTEGNIQTAMKMLTHGPMRAFLVRRPTTA